VRDFHSFRVTWVTLALTAGVPLELVQKVTGHKTTDIVLKHYFQPGLEDCPLGSMPFLFVGVSFSLCCLAHGPICPGEKDQEYKITHGEGFPH
jgi:hypothetical protein